MTRDNWKDNKKLVIRLEIPLAIQIKWLVLITMAQDHDKNLGFFQKAQFGK